MNDIIYMRCVNWSEQNHGIVIAVLFQHNTWKFWHYPIYNIFSQQVDFSFHLRGNKWKIIKYPDIVAAIYIIAKSQQQFSENPLLWIIILFHYFWLPPDDAGPFTIFTTRKGWNFGFGSFDRSPYKEQRLRNIHCRMAFHSRLEQIGSFAGN